MGQGDTALQWGLQVELAGGAHERVHSGHCGSSIAGHRGSPLVAWSRCAHFGFRSRNSYRATKTQQHTPFCDDALDECGHGVHLLGATCSGIGTEQQRQSHSQTAAAAAAQHVSGGVWRCGSTAVALAFPCRLAPVLRPTCCRSEQRRRGLHGSVRTASAVARRRTQRPHSPSSSLQQQQQRAQQIRAPPSRHGEHLRAGNGRG